MKLILSIFLFSFHCTVHSQDVASTVALSIFQPGAQVEHCQIVCIQAAAGEAETLLLKLSLDSSRAAVLSDIEIKLDNYPEHSFEVNVLENVYGLIESTQKLVGPYPDVLSPFTADLEIPPAPYYVTLVLTSEIAKQTASGIYKGELALIFEDESRKLIDIEVEVYSFKLPDYSSVRTYMFGLDQHSLRYWYGLTLYDDEFGNLINTYKEKIKKFRMSLDAHPHYSNIEPSSLPAIVFDNSLNETVLAFNHNSILPIFAPKFESIESDFIISLKARVGHNSTGNILKYQWMNRKAGFNLSAENDVLSLNVWFGESGKNEKLYSVQSEFEPDKWMTVRISSNKEKIEIQINDQETRSTEVEGELIPSYGADFLLGSEKVQFDFENIAWESNRAQVSNGNDKITFSAVDLKKKIQNRESENIVSDVDWNMNALKSSAEHAETINRIKYLEDCEQDDCNDILNFVATANLAERPYVRLPFDEKIEGKLARSNILWANKFKKKESKIDVVHSFGALGGRIFSKKEKSKLLVEFSEYVDVFTFRARYIDSLAKVVDTLKHDGKIFAPYIHDLDKVENKNSYTLGRSFFWKLYARDILSVSYWRLNLWYQPWRKNRPARRIEKLEDGFLVLKRNPSSITTGTMIYPCDQGPCMSLRMHSWRDGMEDVEYLLLLDKLIDSDLDNDPLSVDAKIIRDEVKAYFGVKGNLLKSNENERLNIQKYRARISSLLENYVM